MLFRVTDFHGPRGRNDFVRADAELELWDSGDVINLHILLSPSYFLRSPRFDKRISSNPWHPALQTAIEDYLIILKHNPLERTDVSEALSYKCP